MVADTPDSGDVASTPVDTIVSKKIPILIPRLVFDSKVCGLFMAWPHSIEGEVSRF